MSDVQRTWARPESRLIRRNRGNKFVETLYRVLFPEVFTNEGLNTIDKINVSKCFEHGAFVFKDTGYELFNFLYGSGGEIKELKGRIIKSLSHLIPEYLTKQPAASDEWDTVHFVFFQPPEIINISATAPQWKNVIQYELPITPPIRYLCNPQCETGPSPPPPYCSTLNIGKKKHPKGVIKFYNFNIVYKRGRDRFIDGPYTYVKLESLSAISGIGRHISRQATLFSTKRKDQREAVKARRNSRCFKKSNSAYCYRAENYGYVPQENVISPDRYNEYHNSFPHIANSSSAIRQYNSPINIHSQARIYQLRTGHELFVPQEATHMVLTSLAPPPPPPPSPTAVPNRVPLQRQKTLTTEQWFEIQNSQDQEGGYYRQNPKRRKRKTRRKRQKRRKTRRNRRKRRGGKRMRSKKKSL